MELKFQHLFIYLLSGAFVASHAALTSENCWKNALPNTPMPQSIIDSLPKENTFSDNKDTSVGVQSGGVDVASGLGGVGVDIGSIIGGAGTDVNVRHGGGSTSVSGTYHGKPVNINVSPGHQPFLYNYAATDEQLHDNPNVAIFFLEKNLSPNESMRLHFFKNSNNGAKFVPRDVADLIPFSSNKMSEILNELSVKPNSKEAETMKKTIKECEETSIKGEDKFCATSLESMVDFTTSKLGKNVKAISTNTPKESHEQEYKITGVSTLGGRPNKKEGVVVCHKQEYVYAVYYCHKTETTKAYAVNLVGEDGTKVKAAAICHQDTSAWNPKHLAFHVLNVEPGSVPICHFLPDDHVVWVPSN